MNRISILIKKIPNKNNSTIYHYIDYQKELTYTVKTFPGFLNTDSYIINELYEKNNIDNNLKNIINISTWNNIDYWNNWYNSKEREILTKKYNGTIKHEKIIIMKNNNNNDDIFLL